MDIKDKVKGGLYGVAVGDALGATLEFMGRDIVEERYGVLTDIIGGGWLKLTPGEWTDDTEMTLAVAEGIARAPHDPINTIGEEFLRWYKTGPKDVGTTCAAVFNKVRRGLSWHQAACQLHAETAHTAGNGALMRTLPVALAYPKLEDVVEKARQIAQMTHWDERAALTCQLYCLAAYFLTAGEDFHQSLDSARLYLTQHLKNIEPFVPMWTELTCKMSKPEPTGYTVDTLACALWALQSTCTLEEAVISAVNLGGDADTVGAITGGLAGVCYGLAAIPERWVEKFSSEQRERLDSVAERLLAVRS